MPTKVAYEDIQHGDRVTCLIPNGIGRSFDGGRVQEYKKKTGSAVMHSSAGGWVLNGGGRHGTPILVDAENFVKATRRK